jgi:hypothetical protein
MEHMTQSQKSPSSARETWAIRLALGSFAAFTAFGVYLLFFPTDLLTVIFGALLGITLAMGVVFGLIAVYSS